MTNDFSDIQRIAKDKFGAACVQRMGNAFSLEFDEGEISFAAIPGSPAFSIVRARVLDMSGVGRVGGLALAALEGNFFWSGTNGGTLSADEDGSLWLTERRPVAELASPEGLDNCISEFAKTVSAWRERSSLHE